MKVLFLKEMDQSAKDTLAQAQIEVIVSKSKTESEYVQELKDTQVDGIFCRTEMVTSAMIDASKNLKVIAKQGVGLDNIDMKYATDHRIQVVYAPRGNTTSVAEQTMFLLLACARRFNYVDRIFRDGNFEVRYTLHNTFELEGMTLGLLGCGRIGQLVAKKAINGFGMKVIGFDPFIKPGMLDLPIEIKATKEEVLKEADFVSLHMPSTPETRNSIGAADFALMKPTASFINAARGDVVVEKDLVEALKTGQILGAGLDVFATEPLPLDDPLLQLPQVIATPHTAATTEQSVKRCCTTAAKGIIEVFNGSEISFPGNKIS